MNVGVPKLRVSNTLINAFAARCLFFAFKVTRCPFVRSMFPLCNAFANVKFVLAGVSVGAK